MRRKWGFSTVVLNVTRSSSCAKKAKSVYVDTGLHVQWVTIWITVCFGVFEWMCSTLTNLYLELFLYRFCNNHFWSHVRSGVGWVLGSRLWFWAAHVCHLFISQPFWCVVSIPALFYIPVSLWVKPHRTCSRHCACLCLHNTIYPQTPNCHICLCSVLCHKSNCALKWFLWRGGLYLLYRLIFLSR